MEKPVALHARLSPSSAHRWMICTASPGAEDGRPNSTSDASRDGTVKHLIASRALQAKVSVGMFAGLKVAFWRDANGNSGECLDSEVCFDAEILHVELCNEARVAAAGEYVDLIRQLHDVWGGELYVEEKVPIGHITGETGAVGTADAILESADKKTLFVIDLKGGRGFVSAVQPNGEPNPQLALYALGALEKLDPCGFSEYETVRMMIVQPALSNVSEHVMPIADLMAYGEKIAAKAREVSTCPQFAPSADRCTFCKALAHCDAVANDVLSSVYDGNETPVDPTQETIGLLYEKTDLIETWCKAIKARVRADLAEGLPVVGASCAYMLAEGRSLPRKWSDNNAAELAMRKHGVGLDVMFSRKLQTPTALEALTKGAEPAVSHAVWGELQSLIVKQKGAPVVVPTTSTRKPATKVSVDDFEILN